ncbi:MAG: HesA/MoeB/ThiF family protein [Bacteroidetes bacterium]|nr:HesA/MoeB/ThiF family protein [Bacteroidota bacterium]
MKLSKEELLRYSRHLSLNEFGMVAQLKLKQAKVLVVGAGGLGCPALLYLTAVGIGKIGVIDFDNVETSNLQRQVLYTEEDIGKPKAVVAVEHLLRRNSFVGFESFNTRLTASSAKQLFPDYDLIIDCTDNFNARYIINDACVLLDKPFVYGSIFKFEGQVSLFNAKDKTGISGPTYRCLFPSPPAEGTIPSCEEAGVIGFLPGLIGTLQAAESVKWITGIGESLSGKLLSVNSLDIVFNLFDVARNENLWANVLSNESIQG